MYGNMNRANGCNKNMNNCGQNMSNCCKTVNSCRNNKCNMDDISCKHVVNDACNKDVCRHNDVDYSKIMENVCYKERECSNNQVMYGSNYNRRNKEELRMIITQASFALDDIKLFLDTHPCNKEALKAYDEYKNIRKAALKEYVVEYGPISAYDVNVCDSWDWVKNPWPWEGEC